jgi:hypothetical protein
MKLVKFRPGNAVVVSLAVAEKVAAAAARVAFTREQALVIAEAEPRGVTVFAGSLKKNQAIPHRTVGGAARKKVGGALASSHKTQAA